MKAIKLHFFGEGIGFVVKLMMIDFHIRSVTFLKFIQKYEYRCTKHSRTTAAKDYNYKVYEIILNCWEAC